ncbi:MAG: polysaccharide biosynthesis/export family protein [Phycisphaerae bacterium]
MSRKGDVMIKDARPKLLLFTCLMIALSVLSGCEQGQNLADSLKLKTDRTRFLAPEQLIDSSQFERSPINPILTSVGMVDEVSELPPNATFPRPGDWSYTEEDYRVGTADVLEVGVVGLFQAGAESILRRQVSESGYIDLPLLKEPVYVKGMTTTGVRKAVADAYDPGVLRDPIVSVTILERRQSTFSVLGSVDRPGTYNIMRNDMRVMEALALGGGIVTQNIDYIYVIRPAPAEAVKVEKPEADEPDRQRRQQQQPEQPTQQPEQPTEQPEQPVEEPTGDEEPVEPEEDIESILRELGGSAPGPAPETEPSVPTPSESGQVPLISDADGGAAGDSATTTTAATADADAEPEYEWVYEDGTWQRVAKDGEPVPEDAVEPEEPTTEEVEPTPQPRRPDPGELAPPTRRRELAEAPERQPPPAEQRRDPFGWAELDKSDLSRVIAINLKALQEGDPQMNIIIRPNDIVYVPLLDGAEFYVTGEVRQPGPYNMTGRKVTVKQAISYAGGFSPTAWPENAILIRRVGNTQEQIIPLDLEAIYQGEEPDLYLKADDVIAVGSNWRSPFYAVMRNAFRMTYGFGFIYDRNFANPVFNTPTSRRFTRW